MFFLVIKVTRLFLSVVNLNRVCHEKNKKFKIIYFIKCLLLLGLMLTCKNEEDINLRTVAENAFFTYSGTAPAISEITL